MKERMDQVRLSKHEKAATKQNIDSIREDAIDSMCFDEKFIHVLNASRDNLFSTHKLYDENVKNFWIQEFLFGRKSYNYHRSLLHGPSISTIYRWLEIIDFPRFETFRQIKNIPIILSFWKRLYNFDSLACSISMDAMKVDEDLVINHDGTVKGVIPKMKVKNPIMYYRNQKNYFSLYKSCVQNNKLISSMFIISVCPLSNIHSFPIFVYLSHKGNADENFLSILNQILDILRENSISPIFIGSDADRSYKKYFIESFTGISKFISNKKGIVHNIECNVPLWTNDPAHLLKRGRSRLVTKKVLYVSKFDQYNDSIRGFPYMEVTIPAILKINPNLLPNWFKSKCIYSMDDFYPFYIFSGKTLKNAVSLNTKAELIYITFSMH